MITVLQAGDFTTIQDRGRFGYQAYGMPVAGAMDQYAYRLANLLAGNRPGAAVLEMTGNGGVFKFDLPQTVAFCGADMSCKCNEKEVPNWSSFSVPKGAILSFGVAGTGCRAYLAVRGGFEVPLVLGSRSTYTRAGIGGYEGRVLRQGDVLYVGQETVGEARDKLLPREFIPNYPSEIVLRVLLGPQDNLFSPESVQMFFANTFTVAPHSDRAGYQLKGSRIKTMGKADILSEAVSLGAIQIPAYGRPLIVTADHQTARGFAKIGCIIKADLNKLAQAKEEDTIRFCEVSEAQALQALAEETRQYERIANVITAIR